MEQQLIPDDFTTSRIFPGTSHRFTLFIPEEYDPEQPAGVTVTADQRDCSAVMAELIREKKMPVSVGIFIGSGQRAALRDGAAPRSSRSQEYDALGTGYPEFVIDELIPYIKEKYKLNLTDDPDLCLTAGCSSGGIVSWNMAWERNDFFHRVMLFSPTFCAFRGGDSYPAMIRKYETRKIRCFMLAGTDDMRNSAGDWHLEALRAAKAMEYAGYDFTFTLIEGGRHGCCFNDHDTLKQGMEWCWQDWQNKRVRPLHFSPRISDMISIDSEWEEFDAPLPRKNDLAASVVPESLLEKFSAYAIAPDRGRLYVSDPARRFIFAWSIRNDGTLTDLEKFGHLDLADDFMIPGASDIETDIQDRVYAATELGIQTFSSQSEHNCILPLPGNRAVKRIVLTADTVPYMYAECADGKIFRRPWLVSGLVATTPVTPPSTSPF